MWITAGILLGLVVLVSFAGFHSGPHAHVAAGVIGAVAAGWLVAMALGGRSAPLLWVLLGADLVVSAGVAVMAWSGFRAVRNGPPGHPVGRLEGAEGVAVSDLVPDGIVRVRGEQWSAVSVNGVVPAGSRVQVLRAEGVRIEVWGEDAMGEPLGLHRRLEAESKELST
jgi:membrane-bound ClpP family serine protease